MHIPIYLGFVNSELSKRLMFETCCDELHFFNVKNLKQHRMDTLCKISFKYEN